MQRQEGRRGGEGCLEQEKWKMRQRESETPADNLQMLQACVISSTQLYYYTSEDLSRAGTHRGETT